MKKKIFSLVVVLAMLATSFSTTVQASEIDEENVSAFTPQYTYTNNGYTLEKVSHADVAPGKEDGLADYYEYYDQAGNVHTGVIEHAYTDEEWAEAEARLRTMLTSRHKDYSAEQIDELIANIKENLVGDGCQSYSYSAIGYGDWVYIGTMYGGIGIMRATVIGALKTMGIIDNNSDPDYNNQLADSILDLLYGDHYYVEHVKPTEGILIKINVKTGESEVIMAGSINGMETTLRGACKYNDKLYFVGAILQEGEGDGGDMDNPLDGNTSGAGSAGMPSIYEIDPHTDRIRLVYQATTPKGYAEMVKKNVFPTLRTIIEYNGSLVASVTDENGAHFIAYSPDADDYDADGNFKGIPVEDAIRNKEFVEIADQFGALYDYPAFTTMDSNYGGTVYQIIEFNGDLYAAINAGRSTLGTAKDVKTGDDTGCYRGWAIVKGSMNDPDGAVNDPNNWIWTPIVGNAKNDQWEGDDGARYTFNIDPERYAPGTCTLEVYNGYLYIGDYNDVTLATFGALYKKDFTHLAYNLKQSINLYRLDKDMNVELVVGDATDMFPDGSITGLGSGYYSHSNQYTAKATVWDPDKTDDNDGILFYSTLDEATILRPLAETMNGDVLKMSKEEWAEKINYLKVLIQLLLEKNSGDNTSLVSLYDVNEANDNDDATDAVDLTPEEEVEQALAAAQRFDEMAAGQVFDMFSMNDSNGISSGSAVTLTEAQTLDLVVGIKDGSIKPHSMNAQNAFEVLAIPYGMSNITDLMDADGQDAIEAFTDIYEQIVEYYEELKDTGLIPDSIKDVLDKILTENNTKQLNALLTCLNALTDSVVGCDTYAITTDAEGSTSSLKLVPVTLDGLGDSNNHTMRNFATTDDYLLFCTGNPVKGAQVWRLVDWPGKKTEPTPVPEYYNVTLANTGDGATGAGDYEKEATVSIYAGTREGYTFAGWTSSDVVLTNADSVRASFVMPDKNVTVTANWTKDADEDPGFFPLIFRLTFDSNGGSKIDDVLGSLGLVVDLTLDKYQPVRDGYTFTGWYTDKELTDKVTSVRIGSDSTVYAGWEEIKLPEEKPDIKDIFNDVPSGSYYEDAVIWAVGNGITNGTGEMTFDPDGICTRAQAVTFLWRAAGSPAAEGNVMPFEDVVPGSYYYDAVLWAVENGITKGTSETTFSPDMNCSRAQIVTFLWRSQGSPAADGIILFDDVASDVYYTEAVLWAVSESVTNGTSATTFSPDNNCTRAQIVTFIWRTLAD